MSGPAQTDQAEQAELAARAAQFAADLLIAVRQGSDLTAMSADIDALGAKASAAVTRCAASISTTPGAGSGADTAAINDALGTLRALAEELAPHGDLADPAAADRYFDGYRDRQATLAAVLDALRLGREQLSRENDRLSEVGTTVTTAVAALTKYASLAAGIDDALAAADSLTGPAEQNRLDLLHAVRQRRQDLLTQTAVAEQLVAALAISRTNTDELAAAVRRAVDSTMAALGAAVAVAEAVASRRLVLDRIAAVDDATAAASRAAAEVRARTGTSLDLDAGAPAAALTAAFTDLDAALTALDRTVARTERTTPATPSTTPSGTSGGSR